MASSFKCFFLMFFCLFALLNSVLEGESSSRRIIGVVGPCAQIKDCNKRCIESQFTMRGLCMKLSLESTKLTCLCKA
ncbi:PREDICTED: putative defensin-like protein 31 [Tarenaya hassleriana]|uniref:putative defensin-like protein 31 n=1 Tax=Tarenaya hassleriana TaxID=28532 RepID=UPI0008FD5C1D|nr:PREDICTED: putative defensin-like protein 31 [Tarenaya hassleriana]